MTLGAYDSQDTLNHQYCAKQPQGLGIWNRLAINKPRTLAGLMNKSMATPPATLAVNLDDQVFSPEPTAAPPDLLARQENVDWLIGRETCGFFSHSSDVDGTSWEPFDCLGGTCTISDSYIGCDWRLRTACYDNYGSECPGGRARKRQSLNTNIICCTPLNLHCVTAIMTLGEGQFLTGFQCVGDKDGEFKLHPSTLDASENTETDTTTPDTISKPTSPPTSPPDPGPKAGGRPVNIGAIAGGVIGGVGVLIIVVTCIFYFRRRRREENALRAPKVKPVFADTDYPHPPYANTYEKPDDQLPRVATEMPPFSTVGSNTVAELPGMKAYGSNTVAELPGGKR